MRKETSPADCFNKTDVTGATDASSLMTQTAAVELEEGEVRREDKATMTGEEGNPTEAEVKGRTEGGSSSVIAE